MDDDMEGSQTSNLGWLPSSEYLDVGCHVDTEHDYFERSSFGSNGRLETVLQEYWVAILCSSSNSNAIDHVSLPKLLPLRSKKKDLHELFYRELRDFLNFGEKNCDANF